MTCPSIRQIFVTPMLGFSLTLAAPALAKSRGFETSITTPLSSSVKLEVTIDSELSHRAENLPTKLRDRSHTRRLNAGFGNNGYYGTRDITRLTERLQKKVATQLDQKGIKIDDEAAMVLKVTLTDVRPNRPTFRQLSKDVALSFQSYGTGGAEMKAELVQAGGSSLGTMSYRYFESDIRYANTAGTWRDAHRAIDRFAQKAAKTLATKTVS